MVHLIFLPSQHPWSREERFRPSGYIATSAYWAHKHQNAISTFNPCSRGPTHRSITDTGGGYNLGVVGFPHTTLRPSQPAVSTFYLRAPPDLKLINSPLPKYLKREQTLNLVSGSLHSTSTATYHLSITLLMLSHTEIGLTRINRKVNLNATMVPYNSYRFNAQS
jgi:hypothetical protein